MSAPVILEILPLSKDGVVAFVKLNRPDSANCFGPEVIEGLIHILDQVSSIPQCRAMVLSGRGKHFSAGADLAWMQEASRFSFDENTQSAAQMSLMFSKLAQIPIPTIAVVRGAAYGGAVGLCAACDYVIAGESARFCLSEVKLGILPAVIFKYLSAKIQTGHLRRLALTGEVFTADEAFEMGLVQVVSLDQDLESMLVRELKSLLKAAPTAQKLIKKFHREFLESPIHTSDPVELIAKTRISEEAQQGFQCFFAKTEAPWVESFDRDGSHIL